jgi:hypothetical protein
MTTPRSLLTLLVLVALAGCSAAGAVPTPVPTPEPTPTAVPGPGGGSGGNGGNGGGAPPPGGIIDPGGGLDPILGQATFVTPTGGLIDQRPVSVHLVRATGDANGVTAELRWWSGVPPCSALDSVQVDRDDVAKTIRLTVIEGSGRGDVACIDIAQLKATLVDLGALARGTWTISAAGDAPAIELDVA